MKHIHYIYSFICILFVSISISFALPRFSVINGASCIVCHVNPTGSGLRNTHGNDVVALEELPLKRWLNKGNEDWDGYITDNIQIGGDFRIQSYNRQQDHTIFPMQIDLYSNIEFKNTSFAYPKTNKRLGLPMKIEYSP